jgi:hypothetical protein
MRNTPEQQALIEKKCADTCAAIISELEKRGHKALLATGCYRNAINDVDGTGQWISVDEAVRYERCWPRDSHGKIRVTVEVCGRRTPYPEGKNGINVAKVVDAIERNIKFKQAQESAAQRRRATIAALTPALKRIEAALCGFKDRANVSINREQIDLSLTLFNISEDEAMVIVAAVKVIRS